MIRRPPRATRTDTLFPYPTLFRSAAANALPDPVPEEVKQDRYERTMATCADISAAKLRAKVGRTLDVILDAVDEDGGATGRPKADAPETDAHVLLPDQPGHAPGATSAEQGRGGHGGDSSGRTV